MDPKQLVDEALRRFTVLQAGTAAPGEGQGELVAAFQHLAKLDGWAKVAIDRLAAEPGNARAAADLRQSAEQAVRLHPQFMRTLAEVCGSSGAARVRPPLQA